MFSEFLKLHVSFQFCPADFYRENTLQLRGTFPALDNFKEHNTPNITLAPVLVTVSKVFSARLKKIKIWPLRPRHGGVSHRCKVDDVIFI